MSLSTPLPLCGVPDGVRARTAAGRWRNPRRLRHLLPHSSSSCGLSRQARCGEAHVHAALAVRNLMRVEPVPEPADEEGNTRRGQVLAKVVDEGGEASGVTLGQLEVACVRLALVWDTRSEHRQGKALGPDGREARGVFAHARARRGVECCRARAPGACGGSCGRRGRRRRSPPRRCPQCCGRCPPSCRRGRAAAPSARAGSHRRRRG